MRICANAAACMHGEWGYIVIIVKLELYIIRYMHIYNNWNIYVIACNMIINYVFGTDIYTVVSVYNKNNQYTCILGTNYCIDICFKYLLN